MDVRTLTAIIATVGAVATVAGNAFGLLDKLISAAKWLWRKVHRDGGSGVPSV
jgi:hypothetical protein